MVQAAQPVWQCGWFAQPPLQFETRHSEVAAVSGLDVQIIRTVAEEAGRRVHFVPVDWPQQVERIKQGELHLAMGVARKAEYDPYVRYSNPYRREENALYIRAADRERYRFAGVSEFLAAVRAGKFRLGLVEGMVCAQAELQALVEDPANRPYVYPENSDAESLALLAAGKIDGLLTDRLVAATLAEELDLDAVVEELPLALGTVEICAMFSRASTTEADVADFNRALHAVQAGGTFDKILRRYLLPPIFGITVGGRWFHWLDILGTAAFALSGVILAHRGRYNLIGAFLLSALPAVGGGIVRDLVTGRRPVGVLRSPTYLLLVVAVVMAGYVFFQLVDRAPSGANSRLHKFARAFDALVAFFDTVGLAAFIVMGVRVAVEMHCEPLWLWGPLLAILTGAGGGILRDIVRADYHNPTLKRGFYAEVALVWGLAFSLFLEWEVRRLGLDEIRRGTIVVLLGAFATRLLILYRGWENPFQLGSRHTHPQRRLQVLIAAARNLSAGLASWFEECDGATQPLPLPEIEKRHTAFLREIAGLQAGLDEMSLEPLAPDVAAKVLAFRRQLDPLVAVEATLFQLVREPEFTAGPARELQRSVFVSAATMCAVSQDEERATLGAITEARGAALEAIRARFAGVPEIAAAERVRMLQFMVRFERLVELLHDLSATPPRPAGV